MSHWHMVEIFFKYFFKLICVEHMQSCFLIISLIIQNSSYCLSLTLY
jgi:hypothetical protein